MCSWGGRKLRLTGVNRFFESVVIVCMGIFFIRNVATAPFQTGSSLRLIPVCASCKKVCDEKEFWEIVQQSVEEYTSKQFVYGICLDCVEKYYPELHKEGKLLREHRESGKSTSPPHAEEA